jgi:polyferredoxin
MINCPMHPVDSQAATAQTTEEPQIMTHPGIPLPMAVGGIIMLILVSHIILNRKKKSRPQKSYFTFDLLKLGFLKSLIKLKSFPLIIQSVSIFLFLLIIFAGLFGSQRTNIAPALTWNIWWSLLIFFILGFGSLFCSVCPWEGIAALVTSLSFRSRHRKVGFDFKWPKGLRNIYPALILFIILTWLELGLVITYSPSMTAILALIFVVMAVLVALMFERRAFCRYVCLVGRIQGLYSLFSPVEVRSNSADVCRTCKTQDCYRGNEQDTGCPTHLYPAVLKESSFCTLCTECIRACPHDNLQINARPLAVDLSNKVRFHWDEAIMAVVLLALTSFHGLTMTPVWIRMTDLLRVNTGLGAKAVFSVLMVLMIVAPVLLFWLAALVSRQLTAETGVSTAKLFKAFAYSIIPIALFYHVAHNGMHFFMEAQNIVPLLSDPFGWGWDLFGTAGKRYLPLLTLKTIWWLQIVLIVIGHLYGVIISDRIARKLFQDPKWIKRGLVPLIVTMILYSSFSVWLIAQPMEMRSGM